MTFKIEKGIARKRASRSGDATRKYPFNEMQPGDSFLITGEANPKSVGLAASNYGTRHGMKFSTLKTAEGYRCWRVS